MGGVATGIGYQQCFMDFNGSDMNHYLVAGIRDCVLLVYVHVHGVLTFAGLQNEKNRFASNSVGNTGRRRQLYGGNQA